jgi:hypothetical protein
MRNLFVIALFATGCASAGGPVARYAGEPFDLQRHGPRITGQVCGMDLTLDVADLGGHKGVALSGFADGRFPVHLITRQDVGRTYITGGIGTTAGDAAVNLVLTPTTLAGRVGWRNYQLDANGDVLQGTIQIAGAIEPSAATVAGRQELASMPPATQAALLPALLTCNVQPVGRWGRSSLQVRVGGPAGALPHQSSSLYTRD